MHEPSDSAASATFRTAPARGRSRWWIRTAPHPDMPHPRDPAGAQRGLALAIVAAAAFWVAVVVGVLRLTGRG